MKKKTILNELRSYILDRLKIEQKVFNEKLLGFVTFMNIMDRFSEFCTDSRFDIRVYPTILSH